MKGLRCSLLYPRSSARSSGNAITAQRWATMLRELGHEAESFSGSLPEHDCDLLIALNPRKTGVPLLAFKQSRPALKTCFAITGTDLHGSSENREQTLALLPEADWIICINPRSRAALPENLQGRCSLILQSAPLLEPSRRSISPSGFLLVGHLRKEKDPFLVVEALRLLASDTPVHVEHLGAALNEEYAEKARQYQSLHPFYHWLGEVSRETVEQKMLEARALLITSKVEGAPAVLSEAIAAGLPVIVSAIDGCLGIIGEDYPAQFPVADSEALAALMMRVQEDESFYEELCQRMAALRPKIEPQVERKALAAFLEAVCGS